MHTFDFIVFYAYLAIVLIVGLMMYRRQHTEKEFFLAGRSLGWFPLGISIMITMLTAVNFAAFPTEIFKNGCYVLIALPIFVVVAFPISKIFIPFFQKQKESSPMLFWRMFLTLKLAVWQVFYLCCGGLSGWRLHCMLRREFSRL